MKYIIYIILISFFTISCTMDEEYVETYDPEQARLDSIKQRSDDIELILSYIEGTGLQTVVDTTEEGVLYSLIDSGDFEVYPENNDIISVNLAAYYTTDSIFYTNDSIDLVFFDTNDHSVAESFGIVDESKFYVPLVYTYNGFGSFFPIISDHGYLALVSDFKKALGFSISKISEGGKIKIIMPSGNAYGELGNATTPVIPANAILIFDIHLIKIRKWQKFVLLQAIITK